MASNVVLRHIIDLTGQGVVGTAQYTGSYTTGRCKTDKLTKIADEQPFHTDWGDVVGLYCLSTAAEGGTSRLASISTIYNELAQKRPDIIQVLAGNWAFDTYEFPPLGF